MEKQKSNSDKVKNSQWIWSVLIGLVVFGSTVVFAIIAAIRDLTSVENVLFQFIFLVIGCSVSYLVGQKSVKKAAEEIVKPLAQSTAQYLISLNKSISHARAIASIGLPQRLEGDHEDYQVIRGALIAILYEQIGKTNDALENWRDILEDELEDLIQKRREESITSEELEDFIQQLTQDNTSEDK